MATDRGTRLRADAQRNRDQILTAARERFLAHGAEVPMEEVARSAGVGVGTLYRRFPDRDSLIRAVAQGCFAQVVDDARSAVAEEPTGWAALERLVDRSFQLQLSFQLAWSTQRVRDLLQADRRTGELRNAFIAEIARMVETAQQEGTMRNDVSTGDVVVLFASILRQPPTSSVPGWPGLERSLAIILDGLRSRCDSPLPGQPISPTDLAQWPRSPW